MHTINANAVRGRSYEKFLHENFQIYGTIPLQDNKSWYHVQVHVYRIAGKFAEH